MSKEMGPVCCNFFLNGCLRVSLFFKLVSQLHAFYLQFPFSFMVKNSLIWFTICDAFQSLNVFFSFIFHVILPCSNECPTKINFPNTSLRNRHILINHLVSCRSESS